MGFWSIVKELVTFKDARRMDIVQNLYMNLKDIFNGYDNNE